MRIGSKLGLLLLAMPTVALAEAATPPSEPHSTGRDGLFTRVALGGGAANSESEVTDASLSGAAALLSLDAGGALTRNLALHGRLSLNIEPSLSNGRAADDASQTFALLGVGLTTYLSSHLFLTGVIGFSHAFGTETGGSNGGGFVGDIGYEWPAGGDWGVGIAGRFEIHSVGADDAELMMESFGILGTLSHF